MADTWNACTWLLDRHVDEGRGDRLAVRADGQSFTYAQVQELVLRVATGLRSHGIHEGDRVALVLLDSPAFTASFLALERIGAIPVLINPLLPPRDVAGIASDAAVSLVLVSEPRRATAELLATELEGTPVLVLDDATWRDLTAGSDDAETAHTSFDTDGFWLCTSGSTGRPKLAMHRQGDLKVSFDTFATHVLHIDANDHCFSVGPMFHAYGLGNSLTFPFAVGASVTLEATRPPTPARIVELVTTERPTLFFAIPTFYAALNAAELPEDTFASVRLGVSAAEALPAETWHRFHDRFGVTIIDGIGSTELTHMFVSNRPDAVRPGTSGWVVSGYEARVVDDDDQDQPAGVPGHLLVRGESAAHGYWNQPAATATTFASAQGWVRTGDTYVRDEDDCYTYLGRSDDMLRVAGEWVSPAEVEATLIELPAVLESAVIGTRGALTTEVVAFVVPKPGHAVTEAELAAHCRDRLAGFKRPKRFVLLETLPKTATGKIQRFRLREQL
jgi:benzoate-CoA ligase family protein